MVSYVITGANRGIGLAVVKELAAQPGNVVIGTARSASSAKDLAAVPGAKVVYLDLDDAKTIRTAADKISEITGGSLDVLINNAAYFSMENSADIESFPSDDALIKDVMGLFRTNAVGPAILTNALLPILRKGTKKTVVYISTPVASDKFVRKAKYNKLISYALSKAAGNYLNTQYSIMHEDEGFTFTAVSPGMVNTWDTDPPTEPTPEAVEFFTDMVSHFMAATPNWNGQPQTAAESAKRVVSVIQALTPKDNGKFLSHHGDEDTWF